MVSPGERKLFELIGLYFVHWSSFELAVDIGITKLSDRPPKETLAATRQWTVADKVRKLKALVEDSEHDQREKIIEVLKVLPKETLRNVIAHCYMRFGPNMVAFLQRRKSGELFKIEMTVEEFSNHLRTVSNLAHALSVALGNTDEEADEHQDAL